jgi:predicted membrane protein
MNGQPTLTRGSASRAITPQLIIGLLFLVAGTALLLDNFGVLEARYIIRLWPVGLILLGLAMFAQAQRPAGRFAGGFWIFIGVWLLLGNLHVLRLHVFDLWPVPLVLIGGYLIWQALEGPTASRDRNSESMFSALAVMAGINRKVTAADFRGGEATAVMGGCKIDLREATIASDEAAIDVFAFWGGIELLVPQGWIVINRIVPVLGGADDRTSPSTDPLPKRLVLRGVCVMGGVEIKHA